MSAMTLRPGNPQPPSIGTSFHTREVTVNGTSNAPQGSARPEPTGSGVPETPTPTRRYAISHSGFPRRKSPKVIRMAPNSGAIV
jgi:hypothetical protein